MTQKIITSNALALAIGIATLASGHNLANASIEEIIVSAEKRDESLQDLSQAVTAISSDDLDQKNISSFVDLSAIAPGVTVAKNEGFKTVIAIRGVGNEANQNAVANPSVSFHMDGIYIASPFSLQTDFIDVERIEALRGPQGTLFGQNSTGGAINVISKKPSFDGVSGKADATLGTYNLYKVRGTVNVPLSDKIAMRTSVSKHERDGFTDNVLNGQELDDANNFSARTDWLFQINDDASVRFFAQYFNEDSNGAAIKGIFDPTSDKRKLAQDTLAKYDLSSEIYGLTVELDLGFATLKSLSSYQEDDITIIRDNDRHSFALNPGITRSEFDPEVNVQETITQEFNLISNEPLFGSIDWIVGAFYLDTEVDIIIREELDGNGDGVLEGYALNNDDVFEGEVGFISDANPTRESLSIYGQTTYSVSDQVRVITGLRYTKDEVESTVSNFFALPAQELETRTEEVTGRLAVEYDISDSSLVYGSYTRGFKPGGSNLTFGFLPGEYDFISDAIDASAPLVFPTFDDETIDAYEVGFKSDFLNSRVRTNIAAFYYDYKNMQFQATDPNAFQGGVANIPAAKIQGIEVELIALLSDSLTLDAKMAGLDSRISSDYLALDNVVADGLGFVAGDDILRANLVENVKDNDLAKTPGFTADISLLYKTDISSDMKFTSIIQYTYRGSFDQRILNNPTVDQVDSYEVVNLTASLDWADNTWGVDLLVTNIADEDGVNSRMSDVFGVNATGEELIPPRQVMGRVRYAF